MTELRVGLGYDLHPYVAERPLVLGGVHVEYGRGLAGHSDGDALCHAVVDALLGAAGQVSRQSENLSREVSAFIAGVRVA